MALMGLTALLLAAAYAYLRWIWFYRDPVRRPPREPGAVLAPADGQVVYVRPVVEGQIEAEKLGRRIALTEITRSAEAPRAGWSVGIYMSPLDVHYVYAPADGEVVALVHHRAARNWPMVDLWEYVRLTWLRRAVDLLGRRYHLENERLTVQLRTAHGPMWVVLIADRFVNKIRCFVQEGQRVRAGEKLAFIGRGSQVDLVLADPALRVEVPVGRQVYGALTVVARAAEGSASSEAASAAGDAPGAGDAGGPGRWT